MAKKPKAGKKGAARKRGASPPTEAVKPSEVMKMIGPNDFERLVTRTTSLKKQAKEISGSMGDLVAKAVEGKNLDKPAFDMYRKLYNMSPQKRLTTLACFDYYRDLSVNDKRLDDDETGQAELPIRRQEAGQAEPKKAANGKDAGTPPGEKDIRPPHLRSIEGAGTRADTAEAATG